MDAVEVEFARWEVTPPADVLGDPIWRLPAYRLSRYLAVVVRADVDRIRTRSPSLAEQLERSVDSIGVNIAEGYSRLHGRERARFYEYALGSAREAREWYARADSCLDSGIAVGRAKLLTRTIKILTTAIPQERAGSSERRMKSAIDRARSTPDPATQHPAPSASPSPSKSP